MVRAEIAFSVFLFFTVGFVAVRGFADPTQAKPQAEIAANASTTDCGSMSSQSEMNGCYAREAERVRELLAALLLELEKRHPKESQELQRVQATWTTFRDAHCNWQAQFFDGGTIKPTIHSVCMADISWDRIEALKLDLCEGAGMTGPCEASRRYDRPSSRPK